ncbi:MAG: hypothetical protein ABIF09_08425 [Gemmatimonadota bacterium]
MPFTWACGIVDLGDDTRREPRAGELTVLFIGSSYLEFNDVPGRFEELSRKAGHEVWVKALEWSDDVGLVLAPVGMAFYEVLTEWNPGPHFLHDTDWNHASQAGSYLAAATFFSTIFVESCSAVEYNWKLEKGLAKELRGVASATVLEKLELWKIDWGGGG